MRELRFRGKRSDNGEWVHGCYDYTFEIGYDPQGYDDVPERCSYITLDDAYYEVDYKTVGQLTETTISHSNKNFRCFEGDVVEASAWSEEPVKRFVVSFRNGTFMFGPLTQMEFCRVYRYPQVIGNIHDNSEMKG